MTSPSEPANESPDWMLRNHISKGNMVTVDCDPPIAAQHVAVFRFDKLQLVLSEVMVYGKFYFKYDFEKKL